jgi:hypothetical protein
MATNNEPLRAYLRVQRTYDAELNRVLERTARTIQARIGRLPVGIGGDVRKAQLRSTLAAIRTVQMEMWNGPVSDTIKRGRKAAMEAAENAAETLARVAYTALPPAVAEALTDGLRLSAESGIASDAARIPRVLSDRVYRNGVLASGQVEQIIRQGLIQNLSARELAKSAYRFVSPSAPGGASYSAMRLARTEINNAFHQRQIKGAERPGVTAVLWNLSGSHPKPDECNTLAAKRRYKPENVPSKPHPQCFCYLTYETMPPDEFAAALQRGDFNDELDRRTQANLRLAFTSA